MGAPVPIDNSNLAPDDKANLRKLSDDYFADQKKYDDLMAETPAIDYIPVWSGLEDAVNKITKMPDKDDVQKRLDQADKYFAEHPELKEEDGYYQSEKATKADMALDKTVISQVWHDGMRGENPLSAEVMVLFDTLVHDALLTSWPDQLLMGPLYFQTRQKDVFGVTNFAKEAKEAEEEKKAKEEAEKERAEIVKEGNKGPSIQDILFPEGKGTFKF